MERKIGVYRRFGAMLDWSRGAVLKVSTVKQLINALQKMGYNALELYTEDTFDVEGEPYLGYLRGRYSGGKIKEMDAYAAAHGEYYSRDVHVPQEVREKVPEDVALVYWDYYHTQKENYDAMIESHKEFGREVWFAGGAWTWLGFATRIRFAYETLKVSMRSVRENGIQNVLITAWGDDGGESSFFSVLQVLYAARRYADGEYDDERIAAEFENLFGVSARDFDLLELPDTVPAVDYRTLCNPSKYLLYADPFSGISDATLQDFAPIPYSDYVERLSAAKLRAGEYAYLFDCAEKLCRLLEIKANLGVRTRVAYRSGDKNAIASLVVDYEQAKRLAEEFFDAFAARWRIENKQFGFEVHCIRLGGLIKRFAYCKTCLQAYLDDKLPKIEELEEDILPYYPVCDENELWMGKYRNIVTASEL